MNIPAGIVAVVVLAGFILWAGCTSAPPVDNLTAPEIAGQYVKAQENIQDFSATVEVAGATGQVVDRVQIQKKAPHDSRIEFLTPGSEANGTLVITNGTVIWWYSAFTKTLRTTRHFDPDQTYFTGWDYPGMIARLFTKYPGSYMLNGTDRRNNSYLVDFSARAGEPFTGLPDNYQNARVWIDAGSWMPVRIVLYNDTWPSPVTVEYRDIRVNSGIPDSVFVFDPDNVPNPPKEIRHHDPVIFLLSLEDAYRVLGNGLAIPGYLPEGYAYGGGYQMSDGTLQFSLVKNSDSISYIDSPVIGRPHGEVVDGPVTELPVNGTIGDFRQGKDQNQLQWIKGGHAYTLTGKQERRELAKMAESLVQVNDTLMKTLPWNEPKMAEPLGITELTSIVMPESWVMSHNTSATPGMIGIRLPAQQFSVDFVNGTAYPDYHICRSIAADERVMLYQVPIDMFQQDNPDPAYVHINEPESVFRSYPNLTAVFQEQCKYYKIPCPAGRVTAHE
ncbi:DUF4367 domain-containing protein [Methanoregula sp.]|uniref:DUF4367 domain-containing protein n=1 Tax=Methanoregula sp. TaxID=2052170 RepID=UPI0035682F7F